MHAPTGSALLTLESAALLNPTPSRDCRAAAHLRDVSKSGRELSVYWKIMQTPSEGLPGSRCPEKVKYKRGGNVRSSCSSTEQRGMFGIREGRFGGAARMEPPGGPVRGRSRCPDSANTLTGDRFLFQFNMCIIFINPALFPVPWRRSQNGKNHWSPPSSLL